MITYYLLAVGVLMSAILYFYMSNTSEMKCHKRLSTVTAVLGGVSLFAGAMSLICLLLFTRLGIRLDPVNPTISGTVSLIVIFMSCVVLRTLEDSTDLDLKSLIHLYVLHQAVLWIFIVEMATGMILDLR